MNTRDQIVASIEVAKGELEHALGNLEQLPSLDWGTARSPAHSLGNSLNIPPACVQLLNMSLAPPGLRDREMSPDTGAHDGPDDICGSTNDECLGRQRGAAHS